MASAATHHDDAHGHDDHGHGHGLAHTATIKTLVATGGTLLVLTVVTVLATKIDFGANINLAIAMVIAVTKATLVVLFFMHVKYSTRLTWAVVIGSVFWLGILLVLTMSDYLTRAWRTYG
jgi:cytochrome c oxidase subunit 4